MECITSPALDDIQILSYVEGEADDWVVAHIRECQFCRERANRWASLQTRLTKQLYRVTCPTPIELGDYHLGLLSAPQVLVVAQHVRECPLCRRELARLEGFLAELTPQPGFFEPVNVLVASLINGGGMDQDHPELASTPSFAGLRGEGEEPFIYQADQVRVMVEVQDDVEQMGLKTLLGLVTGLESNDFTVQVSQGEQEIATTSVDEIGNFIIPHLSPGHYKLILTGPNMEIHIRSLPV